MGVCGGGGAPDFMGFGPSYHVHILEQFGRTRIKWCIASADVEEFKVVYLYYMGQHNAID